MRYGFIKRIRAVLVSLIAGIIISVTWISQVHGQITPRPNALVSLYQTLDAAATPEQSFLATVAQGSSKVNRLMDIAPDALLDISTDGKMIAAAGSSDDAEDRVAYGFIGQTLRVVTVDKGHRVLWGAFSPDSRTLAYTTAAQDTEDW